MVLLSGKNPTAASLPEASIRPTFLPFAVSQYSSRQPPPSPVSIRLPSGENTNGRLSLPPIRPPPHGEADSTSHSGSARVTLADSLPRTDSISGSGAARPLPARHSAATVTLAARVSADMVRLRKITRPGAATTL